MSNRKVYIIAAVISVLCLAIGMIIGYFAIKPAIDLPSLASLRTYLESCNSKCSDEIKAAESCKQPLPRQYVAYHLNGKTIKVDGKLDDDAWKDVPWTENFLDIRGAQYDAPAVQTKAKIRWDNDRVYVAAWMEEPHIWATFAEKDTRIYKENAFEVFLDVDNSMSMYKEFEINALGTTWDLMLDRAYMDGGDWYDWEGIADKGVDTDGQVNNANVPATYWSMEVSFPFVNLNENTTRTHLTPTDGEMWFMILASFCLKAGESIERSFMPPFSLWFHETRPRYDLEALPNGTYAKKPNTGASWISWNPIGAINLHLPSKWGLLFFDKGAPSLNPKTMDPKRWTTYQGLFDFFNAEKSFQAQMGTYTGVLSELDLPAYVATDSCFKKVDVSVSGEGFIVSMELKAEPGYIGTINQNRYVSFTKKP